MGGFDGGVFCDSRSPIALARASKTEPFPPPPPPALLPVHTGTSGRHQSIMADATLAKPDSVVAPVGAAASVTWSGEGAIEILFTIFFVSAVRLSDNCYGYRSEGAEVAFATLRLKGSLHARKHPPERLCSSQ